MKPVLTSALSINSTNPLEIKTSQAVLNVVKSLGINGACNQLNIAREIETELVISFMVDHWDEWVK